jgi:uncharacterized repeat protein (TIGR01451 family)
LALAVFAYSLHSVAEPLRHWTSYMTCASFHDLWRWSGLWEENMMRHIKMWKWIPILWVLLVSLFVLVDRAETQFDSLDWSIVHGVDGPAQPDETRESSSSWQMVGQVGGPTQAVAVQGAYAYVGVGLRLVVLDVSDPTTPQEIGSTMPFPQFVEGVTVSGTVAYAAVGTAGLRIVDISDPTHPVEVGAYDTPGYAEGVAVAGQYAYVADGHYGLRVVDIADPTRPTETAYAYPLNYLFDVAVDGQYAYLAAAGAGLLVADISDPSHPAETGTYDTPGYAYGIDVSGDVVYIADGWESLRVVSVSDPAYPAEVGFHDTPGWAFGVDIVGSMAYVADAFAGLRVLDVSDPTQPVELGGYEVSRGHAGSVVVVGNIAYVADRNWGLRMVDVSSPNAPTQIGFYSPLGYAAAVTVSESYAYLAAANYGLRVVDISDPTHPLEVGTYDTQSDAIGVAVVGNYAYVATVSFGTEVKAGLHVVDVSDPAHPTGVGYYGPAWAYRDVAVAGGIVYIANEHGLELIDVSSPYSPTLAATIDLQGEEWKATTGVHISETLAYVAGDGGFFIVDVSNPVSPTLVSALDTELYFDTAVAGIRAYVTGGGACLKIIDVADSLHPAPLGAYCGSTGPERVTVVSSTAYVAAGNGGLWGIDVTNSLTPTLAFLYDSPGYAVASSVVSDTIYIADGQGGLLILQPGGGESEATRWAWSEPALAVAPLGSGTPGRPLMRGLSRRPSPVHYESGGPDAPSTQHQFDVRPTPHPHRIADTCVVTGTADSGPGTLRECLQNAMSGDTITFDPVVFPPESPVTIALQDNLGGIWQGNLTIDASEAGVILDGSGVADGSALVIDSDENVIKGLQILNFPGAGVGICCGVKHNVIGGNRTRGNGPTGEGNVISGNGADGVSICDTGTMSNTVIGNFIGTDASGTLVLGNGFDGVAIYHGASHNRIGNLTPGEGNIISGNKNNGVWIGTENTTGNIVIGNFIGTDMNGATDLGNAHGGVGITDGAFNNTVKGNVISGNGWDGIGLGGFGSDYNVVIGNFIGTDASGTSVLGNGREGVSTFQSSFNRIGGTAEGDRNIISGNKGGIVLGEYIHNLILGNFVGTDVSGTNALGNAENGIMLWSGHNFIGGSTEAERNVISGNGAVGIMMTGGERNLIASNYIGTDAGGTVALANGISGIESGSAKYSVIQGNLIAGNEESGVSIGYGSNFNHLRANRIGVAADGVSPLSNGMDGVGIWAASNTVGGPYPEDGNTIAFNANVGVQVWIYPGNTIRRNSIYGNSSSGIHLADGGNNLLAPPVITHVLPGSVSGTACPGCIVEVFENGDTDGEGETYMGDTTADASGAFTVTVSYLTQPYLTATATDAISGTSEFSAVFATLPNLSTSTKSVNKTTVSAGDGLTYTITLTNTGTADTTANVTDTLPANVTWAGQFTASTGMPIWDGGHNRLLWSGPVDVGIPVTITYQMTVNLGIPGGTLITNTAAVDDRAGNVSETGPVTVAVASEAPGIDIYLPIITKNY